MNADFWSDKRVFLTGHTGFKGSWLSLWLQVLGARVVGYALEPPTRPALFELGRVSEGLTSVPGDMRDGDHLRRTIEQHRPEIVFHLAAQPLVREAYRNPVDTFATNVMGTVHLLEAVRQAAGVRAVVCVTSDKCYENREWLWGYREYEAMGGLDPYSSSKGCAELVAKAYRNLFQSSEGISHAGVALATARAGNVIGGGDWARDRLVPDVLRSFEQGESVLIRNPGAIRPWQHVLDPLHGYLTLAEHLFAHGQRFADGWNFGPPESDVPRPVEWVVEHLRSLWGADASWRRDERTQPHEDIHLRLDCSKSRLRLGWQAQLELPTALEWVVEWFHAYQAGSDVRDVCRGQIDRFTRAHRSEATEARRSLDALLSSEQQAQLLELAPDTMMLRKLDGTITYWNKRAEQLYGWTREEAVGRTSHSLLQTQFPTPLDEIERQLLSTGFWEGALVHTTRDGQRVDVSSFWATHPERRISDAAVLEINRAEI